MDVAPHLDTSSVHGHNTRHRDSIRGRIEKPPRFYSGGGEWGTTSPTLNIPKLVAAFARGEVDSAMCYVGQPRTFFAKQLSAIPTEFIKVEGPFLPHTGMYTNILAYLNEHVKYFGSICQSAMNAEYLKDQLSAASTATRESGWLLFVSFAALKARSQRDSQSWGVHGGKAPPRSMKPCLHIAGVVFAQLMRDELSKRQYFHLDLLCGQVGGKGIGKDLIQAVKMYASMSGCAWIELQSVYDKIGFYEHMKFVNTGILIQNSINPPLTVMRMDL